MLTAVLPYRSGDVARLGVSADGQDLLFDHGNELRVLSLEGKQIEGVIQDPAAAANFTTMALFAPDGDTMLTNCASEGRLQLWRTPIRLGGEDRAAPGAAPVHVPGTRPPAAPSTRATSRLSSSPARADGHVLVWTMPTAEEVQRRADQGHVCRCWIGPWTPAPARCASGPSCRR